MNTLVNVCVHVTTEQKRTSTAQYFYPSNQLTSSYATIITNHCKAHYQYDLLHKFTRMRRGKRGGRGPYGGPVLCMQMFCLQREQEQVQHQRQLSLGSTPPMMQSVQSWGGCPSLLWWSLMGHGARRLSNVFPDLHLT